MVIARRLTCDFNFSSYWLYAVVCLIWLFVKNDSERKGRNHEEHIRRQMGILCLNEHF